MATRDDVVLESPLARAFRSGDETGIRRVRASGTLLAGIVLWHVIYQSQIAMSTGFLEETWTRNLLNMMVTPVREVEYVAGVALFGMVKLVMGVGVMVLGALAFFSFHTWSLGFGLIPIAVTLLIVGWAISLFVIGLVLRFGTGAEALAWGVMFVLLPLSGVFYPTDALPLVMRPSGTRAADHPRVQRAARPGRPWRPQLDPDRDRRGGLRRDAAARRLVPGEHAEDVPRAAA